MIKTTAKNLRVTLSRKHLTRCRNQVIATKSLEYMFHYIKWRPTSVIKKHSLPSETEFFFNKEGYINPPPQPKTKKNSTKIVWPPVTQHLLLMRIQSVMGGLCWAQLQFLRSIVEQQGNFVRSQSAREAPQEDFFLVSDVTKDKEIFFQGFQTSPDSEGLIFLVADVTRRWLPEVPDVTSEVPSPVRRIQKTGSFLRQKIL